MICDVSQAGMVCFVHKVSTAQAMQSSADEGKSWRWRHIKRNPQSHFIAAKEELWGKENMDFSVHISY